MKYSLYLCLVLLFTNCSEIMHKKYFYSDGNGNGYILSGDTLRYNPIDPMHSSSGDYSGGEARDLIIKDEDRKVIIDLLNEAISKPEVHEDKRRKGTGMITIMQGTEMERYIIRWKTEQQRKIEEALQGILEE